MARTTQRARRQVGRVALVVASPLFRYSISRDAYVLRIVGNRFGPVLQLRRPVLEAGVVAVPAQALPSVEEETP